MSFDLPDGWKTVKLGEVCESISNTHKSIKKKMILINTSDILEGKVNNHTYTNTENMAGQFKKSIQPNDILYSEIRPKNKRYALIDFVANDYICSTKLMVIRGNSKISTKFLYLYLTSSEVLNILQEQAEGRSGTFPQITFDNVANLDISLPHLPEQRAIANTLSCIDNKIELNNRTNKTLEETAQAIFKRWFVDFEFPNEDGQPYKSSGGAMMDSDLGEIPQGWRVGTVTDFVVEMKNGGTPSRKNEDYWNSRDIPWIKTGEILNQPIIACEEYISIRGFENSSTKLLPINSVLIALYGATAAKLALLRFEATTNQACCAMICNSANSAIYLFLNLLDRQEYIKSLSIGSAQQNLSKDIIATLPLIIPPLEIIKLLPYDLIYNAIEKNMVQSRTLTTIRDTLLPKLMSGEIRIPLEV